MIDDKIVEYAPIIIVALGFIWQNNIFVKPEQLEKKHREILKEIEKEFGNKYVELNAYKEFQNHVLRELEDANRGINEVKEILINRGKYEN